jgi:hypothetical protein
LYRSKPLTKIIWRIRHMTFGLAPPKNVTNLFWNWIKGIPKKDLVQIRVGVCVVIWTRWNTKNCSGNWWRNTRSPSLASPLHPLASCSQNSYLRHGEPLLPLLPFTYHVLLFISHKFLFPEVLETWPPSQVLETRTPMK